MGKIKEVILDFIGFLAAVSLMILLLANFTYASSTCNASTCNTGVCGGQCVNFARNYFLNQSFTWVQMPALGTNGGAYMIYSNWNLGFGQGAVPADNSLLILSKTSTLTSGHVAVVITSTKNTDGTYSLIVNESNWDLDELLDCGVNYIFDPLTMSVKRNSGASSYPVEGFVYGSPLIKITPFSDKTSGNIAIEGSGFGTEQGTVTVTTYALGKLEQWKDISATILPSSWSNNVIYANIFQGDLKYEIFDYPVTITVKNKNGIKVAEATYPFKDVKPNDTFACAVQQLWKNKGEPISPSGKDGNGNFKPREVETCNGVCPGFITRAEFVTMAIKSKQLPLSTPTSKFFYDVALNAWYAPYVLYAKNSGINGQSCGDPSLNCFSPDRQITRYEAAVMLAKLYNLTYVNYSKLPLWTDYNPAGSPAPYILFSHTGTNSCTIAPSHVMAGHNGLFRPNDRITRDEAAGIISLGINAIQWF